MNEMTTVAKMKLTDLKPAEYNPRKITDEAFAGLGNSISRFGILSHIVWNKRTGNIVGGHQRYKHLVEMGEIETEVIVVDLDDNEEVALNITLNNKAIRGDFTKDVVNQLRASEAQLGSAFKQIGLLDLYENLRSRGFEKKVKEKLDKIPKEHPESKEVQSQGGDVGDILEKPVGDKPQAVLTCPGCKSKWKLQNNEVICNTVTGTGNSVGV